VRPAAFARTAAVVVLGALSLLGAGCANVQLAATQPTPATLERLRGSPLAPMRVGRFALAAGLPADLDRRLPGLRGSTLTADKGSFAQLLRDTLIVELTAAGLHDVASRTVVEGELLDSHVDAAIDTGTGRLSARFVVRRDDSIVFDKPLTVQARWASSFMGPVAVPEAMNQYHGLYKALVGKLVDDTDFRRATAP
jgi:hypothetical protein